MKTDIVTTKKTDILFVKIEPSLKTAFADIAEKQGMGVSARLRMLIREFVENPKGRRR